MQMTVSLIWSVLENSRSLLAVGDSGEIRCPVQNTDCALRLTAIYYDLSKSNASALLFRQEERQKKSVINIDVQSQIREKMP